MESKIKTTIAFTSNILTTGAFFETSKNVEKEITSLIDSNRQGVIVEFGMGHGNITKEILNQMGPKCHLFAFEVNSKFCEHVEAILVDERLTIINDSAENFKKYVPQELTNIISSIPFSFLTKDQTKSILNFSYAQLENNSFFSQVLYTKFNFKKFQKVFDECELKNLGGFPTEYIYHCKKIAQ